MSKDKNPRRVADNEAMAKTRMLRTSPQKLNLVAQLIRGKKVDKALTDLTFSKKRISGDVKKCLQSAIANAENNHNLDVDELIVAEAWVGKNMTMKRGRPRARGRFGKILKPFAEVTILVRQVEAVSGEVRRIPILTFVPHVLRGSPTSQLSPSTQETSAYMCLHACLSH